MKHERPARHTWEQVDERQRRYTVSRANKRNQSITRITERVHAATQHRYDYGKGKARQYRSAALAASRHCAEND